MTIINNGITNSKILLANIPLSERFEVALLNTVLGMGVVFAVLILFVFLISLFKYLPGLLSGEKNIKKTSDLELSPVDNAMAQIVSQEESNLMNDQELVAVITAAICEFNSNSKNLTDVSAGGFIVRSIRKVK